MKHETAMQVNGWVWLFIGYLLGLGLAVLINHLKEPPTRLKKSEWRCVEYTPGSAECAVYERIGYRGEGDDADPS